jgi:Fe-S cluster biogenesis protein NfuA
MDGPDTRTDFRGEVERLDALLESVELLADPAARQRTTEIVQSLLALHGEALTRILSAAAAAEPGEADALADLLAGDELVSAVLAIHGLHPVPLEARVRRALEKVGPYLASHGGHVELLAVNPEGLVSLRLEGSCHGCPSSRVTLQSSIEQEIFAAAPEVTAIVVEGLVDALPPAAPAAPGADSGDGFVPLERLAINGSALRQAAAS